MTVRLSFRNDRSQERGAVLVEMAIVIVPIVLMLFSFIEVGLVFRDSLTLSAASRSGARLGSSMTGVSSDIFFPEVSQEVADAAVGAQFQPGDQIWIFRATPDGQPIGDTTCGGGGGSDDCVVYSYATNRTWQLAGGQQFWDPTKVDACLGSRSRDSVGVRVSLRHTSASGLAPGLDNMRLSQVTVMKFEPNAATATGCI